MENIRRVSVLLLSIALIPRMAFTQSKAELADSRSGFDVGFDATPVVIPRVQETTPRPVTCMDLLTLRDTSGMQISPDGKYIAFVLRQAVYETNSYRTGIFVISTAQGSQPLSLGTAGPARWDNINEWVLENPQWSPDDKYIYRTMKTAGILQVWRWNREGGAPEQVTHAEQDVQAFYLNRDGTKLLMMLETPSPINRQDLSEQGILYDGTFDATGQSIIERIASTPGGENQPWILDLTSTNAHRATPAEVAELNLSAGMNEDPLGTTMRTIFTQKEIDDENILSFAISPDHTFVAYTGIADNPAESPWTTYPLRVKPLAGGPPVTIVAWPEYAGLFWWGANSKEVYYSDQTHIPEDPLGEKFKAVPVQGGKARLIFESPFHHWMYSMDRSNRFAAFLREDNTTMDELALADLSTGEIHPLAALNPEVQNFEITPAHRIDTFDKRGEHYWGRYVLPLGYHAGKRYPLVITTYADYGFLRGGVGDEYPIHVLTANGFVVLSFNALIRTASHAPNDFDSIVRRWQGPIEAMEAATAKLSDMGLVDSSRVGITGLSYGAAQVDYGISHSNLFRAAIDSGGGANDPISYYLGDDISREDTVRWDYLGLPEGDVLQRYRRVSLALNASKVHTPLLINASDAEYIYDMQGLNTLRALKKPVEMFIYPNERHEKNQPKHRYSIYKRNVDWLNFWLNGKEDPDPTKAQQYKRWRELRNLQEANEGTQNSH